MAYYDYVFEFDVTLPAKLEFERTVARPTGKRFFAIVLGVTALYVVLVMAVTLVFLCCAGSDVVLGASWASVARVAGPATDEWLAASSTARDGEIASAMRRAGLGRVLVGLERVGSRIQTQLK